jgi:murein DD-endopeptidase MepM/ murein hydrolase activator NlpD
LKGKKTFSDWLTNRYLLVVRNEENFAEKTTFSFNYAKIIVFITITVIFLFSFSFYLSNTILSRWFHPAGRQMVLNKKIIQLSAVVDSLEDQLVYRDKALTGISKVLHGDDKFLKQDLAENTQEDTLKGKPKPSHIDSIASVDADLRKEFENKTFLDAEVKVPVRSVANSLSVNESDDLYRMFLFAPINGGMVTQKFDAKAAHYGLDIVAKKDEPVKCVADGTVILSSWTNDSGHIIAVQHQGNLISVYKHNSVLLKKMGSFVRAGEIISVIGNSGELTTGPHLHFELWHNSNPIDPEIFVSL